MDRDLRLDFRSLHAVGLDQDLADAYRLGFFDRNFRDPGVKRQMQSGALEVAPGGLSLVTFARQGRLQHLAFGGKLAQRIFQRLHCLALTEGVACLLVDNGACQATLASEFSLARQFALGDLELGVLNRERIAGVLSCTRF